jgi:5-methylcytosine-specific restriction endonuclease McrA|tara:strand:+ start:2533 stop:3720 length:1188 start_codon:yes stop_codon:yes gene_type:complete
MPLIMPKGDGTLKAINSSVKIYYNNKNKKWLVNDTFKKLISEEMGFEFLPSGEPARDHPFLIKKSEIARYFGLIEYKFRKKGKITKTGIKYHESQSEAEKIKIIIQSLNRISFNKGNSGVEKSNSFIEPPKLLLKAIHDLKYITKKEFGLLLFRTANQGKTFKEGIDEMLMLRANKQECPNLPQKLKNKYNDIKFQVFFENLNIIKRIDKDLYLSDHVINNHLREISKLSIYNQFVSINDKQKTEDKSLYKNLVYPIVTNKTLKGLDNRRPERPGGGRSGRYKTIPKIAETVLAASHYECFFDPKHITFIKKNGDIYMEGHHFIPMSAQDDLLPINLDRRINIVSLCPTCHKKMHKARKQDRYSSLKTIYDDRIENLNKEGIRLSFNDLFENYYS